MANRKFLFLGTLLALVGLYFGGMHLFRDSENKKVEQAVAENKNSLVRDYSPSQGSEMLRVTLVEFLDPECESCRFFHSVVKDILKRHEGNVRYVVRYAPFHGNSKFAIAILEAARVQGKYWETLDLLFEKQPEWGDHHNPQPERIWGYLPSLGLDIEKLKVDMKDEKIAKMIEQEIKDGAVFGVRQTPSFFVNGQPLRSFGPEQLAAAIEAALQ